jgi:inhibitor of KinA sporulation pathway (predicted exonuclease)
MGAFKLHFKGTAHRADVDAANTLALFFKLIDRQRKLEHLADDAKTI